MQLTLWQVVVMAIVFTVIGLLVLLLSRVLRCEPVAPSIANPRRSMALALIAASVSMGGAYLLLIAHRAIRGPTPPTGPRQYGLIDLVPQLIGLAIYAGPAGVFMWRHRENLRSVGIGTQNLWQSLVIGTGLALSAFFFKSGGFAGKIASVQLLAVAMFAFVGFEEEFLFRGYLQNRLVAVMGRWRGWVCASVIFALWHFPRRLLIDGMSLGTAAAASLALIPAGLLLGFVMLRTGNLVAPALFHTFINVTSELGP